MESYRETVAAAAMAENKEFLEMKKRMADFFAKDFSLTTNGGVIELDYSITFCDYFRKKVVRPMENNFKIPGWPGGILVEDVSFSFGDVIFSPGQGKFYPGEGLVPKEFTDLFCEFLSPKGWEGRIYSRRFYLRVKDIGDYESILKFYLEIKPLKK